MCHNFWPRAYNAEAVLKVGLLLFGWIKQGQTAETNHISEVSKIFHFLNIFTAFYAEIPLKHFYYDLYCALIIAQCFHYYFCREVMVLKKCIAFRYDQIQTFPNIWRRKFFCLIIPLKSTCCLVQKVTIKHI